MRAARQTAALWTRRRWSLGLTGSLMAMAMMGCASPARTERQPSSWSGRLAIQVDDPSVPSYAAAFELEGSAIQGTLRLLSPLGTVLGQAEWSPGGAELSTGSTRETAQSLDALLLRLTGTALPVAALFDWLQGQATSVPGWRLERLDPEAGRIVAHREQPLPRVSLRIAVSP